jgi:hypothetical protein
VQYSTTLAPSSNIARLIAPIRMRPLCASTPFAISKNRYMRVREATIRNEPRMWLPRHDAEHAAIPSTRRVARDSGVAAAPVHILLLLARLTTSTVVRRRAGMCGRVRLGSGYSEIKIRLKFDAGLSRAEHSGVLERLAAA